MKIFFSYWHKLPLSVCSLFAFMHAGYSQQKTETTVIPGLYPAFVSDKLTAGDLVYRNLEDQWDSTKVCENPNKGWYIHYFDNGLDKYGSKLAPDDYLEDFPGLHDIYLRLAWSYLEPEENQYHWEVIDSEIDRWTKKGYKISFRITTRETHDAVYATPEWVKNAGAKGVMIQNGEGKASWEPDYGDPVFLEKLENFHATFAARYGGQPWLAYVDIGSYGDWGEGHTAFGSGKDWPLEVIKKHIDIHTRHYQKSQLIISDDFVGSRKAMDGSREKILAYIIKHGIGLRDDSVLVKYFADRHGYSSFRNPEFFDLFWRHEPVVLELQHFPAIEKEKLWRDGKPLVRAVEESHATYIGFHGWPREWLGQNKTLAHQLANRAGYWYFLKSIRTFPVYYSGQASLIELVWENHGVAPAYQRYLLTLRLTHKRSQQSYDIRLKGSDNRQWLPGVIKAERLAVNVPEDIALGKYQLSIGMYDTSGSKKRMIELALKDKLKDRVGFYYVADIQVAPTKP